MRAFLCEFPWQVPLAEAARGPKDLLVACSPHASLLLGKRGLAYLETSEINRHEALWAEYVPLARNSLDCCARLDELLWSVDARFAASGFRYFDALHLKFKIWHDLGIYSLHLFDRLVRGHGVDTLVCAAGAGVVMDGDRLPHPAASFLEGLGRLYAGQGPLRVETQPLPGGEARPAPASFFSFGQPLKQSVHGLRQALADRRTRRRRACLPPGTRVVLNVGCKEIRQLFADYDMDGMFCHEYNNAALRPGKKTWPHLEAFMDLAGRDEALERLTRRAGTSLWPFFAHCVRRFAEEAETVLNAYARDRAYLDAVKPDCVVFQSMAPFYLPNVTVRDICRKRDIPYYCWMHGGYGAYCSLPNYDISDYRFCRDHIVYGDMLADSLHDDKCILKSFGLGVDTVHVNGSPYFDAAYAGYARPENEKKLVLFAIGNTYAHNHFYFGYNRAQSEMSLWKDHRAILRTLAAFQDRYRIVLKDYPGSAQEDFWREVLREVGGQAIRYENRVPFTTVLGQADVAVFPWISTTFIQALYTDADIFLYDDSDFCRDPASYLGDAVCHDDDIARFCRRLAEYLEEGRFYTRDKTSLRRYAIDYGNRKNRGARFLSLMNQYA